MICISHLPACHTCKLCPLQVPTLLGALLQKLPLPEIPHGEQGLIETIWLLLTSVVSVPLISKLPGGSPVLGFLVRTPVRHAEDIATAHASSSVSGAAPCFRADQSSA